MQALVAVAFVFYPLTYANPLAGGPWIAARVLSLDWGEGAGAAARWLNRRAPIVLSCHGLLLSSKRPTWPQRLAARAVDAVTAVSVDAAQRYARFFGLTRGFELTPNGVDPVAVGSITLAPYLDAHPPEAVMLARA